MSEKYTAKIYVGVKEIMEQSGNNADDLYTWMLLQAQGKLGEIHGELVDNASKKIIKKFRKSAPD